MVYLNMSFKKSMGFLKIFRVLVVVLRESLLEVSYDLLLARFEDVKLLWSDGFAGVFCECVPSFPFVGVNVSKLFKPQPFKSCWWGELDTLSTCQLYHTAKTTYMILNWYNYDTKRWQVEFLDSSSSS